MDSKYKFVVFVFLLIVLLYVMHFVLSYMNSQRKQESFTEEIEPYDDSAVTDENKNYKLRMTVLGAVDNLKISDKVIKSKLTDYLFSDPIIKDLGLKNDADITQFVATTYTNMVGGTIAQETITVVRPENTMLPSVPTPTPVTTQVSTTVHSDVLQNVNNKVDELMNHVTNLSAGLDHLKTMSQPAAPTMLPPAPSTSAPVVPVTSATVVPPVTAISGQAKSNIEGFENIREYSFL